jgi:hypothetical protein
MNRPIFVHRKSEVLDRISNESGGTALVTSSLVQALQWVTNPEVAVSGIYFSPDDASFSAFRFLEITLTHRPAIPIFLFESQLSENREAATRIMKNAHVKGVFQGMEPYSVLVSSLKVNVQSTNEPRTKLSPESKFNGYLAQPISDFYTGSSFVFDVFIPEKNELVLFGAKDSPIDADYLKKAAFSTQFLYIREEAVEKSKTDIKDFQKGFIDNPDLSSSWKTAEMMVGAKGVLTEMKSSGMNEQLVEYTQNMLSDLFRLIARIESDEGSMSNMIEKAKECDRSVFCASYSMLVCKQLKFEKTATLEILGLASVLQDISLYRTPFGDLSEKLPKALNEEEMKFYVQHPTLSADVVSHHTDVPQVTLQVVRQHHERKDKSGFPHRVGGSQLHPMAEILSLINSYYEITKSSHDDAHTIAELQKEVFPHFSENVVVAFKQVLGNMLKDKIHANEKGL